jgi:hypothetical protein
MNRNLTSAWVVLGALGVAGCVIKSSDDCPCANGGPGGASVVTGMGGAQAGGATAAGGTTALGGTQEAGTGGAAADVAVVRDPDACSYTGDASPTASGWEVLGGSTYESATTVAVSGGILHLTDASTTSESRLVWGKDCFASLDAGYTYVVEATVKSVSCSDYAGFVLGFGSATNAVELTVFTDNLQVGGGTGCNVSNYAADLTSTFRTVRMELTPNASGPGSVETFIDGESLDVSTPCPEAGRQITFGLGSRTATAEGYIDEIHAWREKR